MINDSAAVKKRDGLGNFLIFLGCMVYFSSYVMRYSYSVSMANIIEVVGLSETEAGAVLTALFLSYGLGQIVSGFMGDKINPFLLILAGVAVGTVCNFVFPLNQSVYYLAVIWAINGFAQAMIWPPMVKILADRFDSNKCATAIVLVSVAANIATVLLYLVIPAILNALDWKSVFYISGAVAGAVGILWGVSSVLFIKKKPQASETTENINEESMAVAEPKKTKAAVKILPMLAGAGIISVMFAIVCQGFLRDGITSWFPSYLAKTFSIPTSMSILVTAALSVFAIISLYVYKWIYRRFCRNEITVSIISFGIAALLALLLFFLSNQIVVTVGCSALIVGISHGINLMLIAYIPPHFAKKGLASTVSGVTNACTYIGSGVSSYLFALVAERIGWNFVVLFWALVSLLGLVSCLLSLKKWNAYLKEEQESVEVSEVKEEEPPVEADKTEEEKPAEGQESA